MAEQTEKPEWWDQAKKELSEADPVMAQIIRANPEGFLATRGNPFETLLDRKSTRLNSSHPSRSRMPSSA